MKKMLFAAFTCMCVISSIMATTARTEKGMSSQRINQLIRDTVPGKKTDTTSYPKRDTTTMPRMIDQKVK